ncbi:MAG TPA: hypothetical protein VEX67_04055 [Solirubrobacteraceae bacterium]|nr:hypothetical protein [Solirubrobacteraceae bacterium]
MVERERLEGRWVHSHEEDTDDEMVFRSDSSGYQFPRSRGREALELNADGSYGGTAPGPVDKPEATAGGEWTIEDGNKLVLGDRVLEITAAEGDVLRVRKR